MRTRDQSKIAENYFAAGLLQNGIQLMDLPDMGAKQLGPKVIPMPMPMGVLGFVIASGVGFATDVKSGAGEKGMSFADCFGPLDKKKNHWKKEHQFRFIKSAGEANAISGLSFYAYHVNVQKAFWLPYTELDRFKFTGSIQWNDSHLIFLGRLDEVPNFSTILRTSQNRNNT